MSDDIIERYSKHPAPDEVLHDAMCALAKILCSLPTGIDDMSWREERLNKIQCRAISEHHAAGRVNYFSIPDEPGVIFVAPSTGLVDWWCKEVAKAKGTPEAVWLGRNVVRVGDRPVALEFQEATVLESLILLGGAALRPDLEHKANVEDVANVMKKLKHRFPDYITLPGRRSAGGYSTTIKDGTKDEK